MDIDGAKALKERLERRGAAEPRAASVDVPADAPPVYHWLGVGSTPDRAVAAAPDKAAGGNRRSWLGRARLGFRPAER
jgi:hypothetical protein